MLYVGCAVWAYDGWANNFFPQGLPKDERLQSYARRLTAVEGNSTFYAMPSLTTVQRWAADTPETFRFCPKFPKAISHTARLKDVGAQTASFVGAVRLLGPRLGPLMLQLPPNFGPNRLGVLRDYLERLPDKLEVAVEIRHLDWFKDENGAHLDEVLTATGAARVLFDSRPLYASKAPEALTAQERKPKVPLIAKALQSFVIVRYIGSPILEENEAYFAGWVPRIAGWLDEGRHVYFFAHCPVETLTPGIARDLYRRVGALTTLLPLPWDDLEGAAPPNALSQLSLF
jgi:uncharacterized protein YecE (DUF72 family)